jgi:hypothetical protein
MDLDSWMFNHVLHPAQRYSGSAPVRVEKSIADKDFMQGQWAENLSLSRHSTVDSGLVLALPRLSTHSCYVLETLTVLGRLEAHLSQDVEANPCFVTFRFQEQSQVDKQSPSPIIGARARSIGGYISCHLLHGNGVVAAINL